MTSNDQVDRSRECQELLEELEELSKHEEQLTSRLAHCIRTYHRGKKRSPPPRRRYHHLMPKKSHLVQSRLDVHRELVTRQISTIRILKSAYHGLIMELTGHADKTWYLSRREALQTIFGLTRDVHARIMRRSKAMFFLLKTAHNSRTTTVRQLKDSVKRR
ncbi:MAG: hypothetical protein M1828_005950 [Chrysothrix sp. TS-e1954]|nr:MAG: hypothetical protein M1828_005950 [Chrysothrix sp. TS-e1954]